MQNIVQNANADPLSTNDADYAPCLEERFKVYLDIAIDINGSLSLQIPNFTIEEYNVTSNPYSIGVNQTSQL